MSFGSQWDFSSASLQHRPRYAHGGTSQRRASIVSMHSMSRRAGSAGNLNADAMEDSPFGLRYHPAPLRSDVAMIQPVSVSRLQSSTRPSSGVE